MKKIIIALVVVGMGMIPMVSSAHTACEAGDLYSIDTGQLCTAAPIPCLPGDLYNSETGALCSVTSTPIQPHYQQTISTLSQQVQNLTIAIQNMQSSTPATVNPVTPPSGGSTPVEASTLAVVVDSSNPVSSTHTINPYSGVQTVPLVALNAIASGGNVVVTHLNGTLNTSGTLPTAIYFYVGNQVIYGYAISATSTAPLSFNLSPVLGNSIGTTTPAIITIKADFPSTTIPGTIASVTMNSIEYSSNGESTILPLGIQGNSQTFSQ